MRKRLLCLWTDFKRGTVAMLVLTTTTTIMAMTITRQIIQDCDAPYCDVICKMNELEIGANNRREPVSTNLLLV